MLILPEKDIINRYLQRSDGWRESSIPSQIEEHNERALEYLMLFIKESLKFILLSFFKRSWIILKILNDIKKNFQNDSKESIFAEMLSSNMRWVFLTIKTCIDKVENKVNGARNAQSRHNEESEYGMNKEKWPIMHDL